MRNPKKELLSSGICAFVQLAKLPEKLQVEDALLMAVAGSFATDCALCAPEPKARGPWCWIWGVRSSCCAARLLCGT